ncbi:MAG: hypothetical protein WC291_10395 [Thermodesulfovibrionales bacterium]|jgi:hypothetical protein
MAEKEQTLPLIPSLEEWCQKGENRVDIVKEVLYLQLACENSPVKILAGLGVAHTPANLTYLNRKILEQPDYLAKLELAKRDMVASVLDRFRERAHRAANKMEYLSESAKEERTQFMATKDILDRAGTGAVNKISVSSPEQYRRIVAEFLEATKEEK